MFTKSQQTKTTSKPASTMTNTSTVRPNENRTTTAAAPRQNAESAPSIISADMRVSGDLHTQGDVQIDGTIDGDISSNSLTIGKTAVVNGEVAADTVRVFGKVNGRIRSKDVSLQETAEVRGDILHHSLEVVRGAFIEGMVKQDTGIAEVGAAAAPVPETARLTPIAGGEAGKTKSSTGGSQSNTG